MGVDDRNCFRNHRADFDSAFSLHPLPPYGTTFVVKNLSGDVRRKSSVSQTLGHPKKAFCIRSVWASGVSASRCSTWSVAQEGARPHRNQRTRHHDLHTSTIARNAGPDVILDALWPDKRQRTMYSHERCSASGYNNCRRRSPSLRAVAVSAPLCKRLSRAAINHAGSTTHMSVGERIAIEKLGARKSTSSVLLAVRGYYCRLLRIHESH